MEHEEKYHDFLNSTKRIKKCDLQNCGHFFQDPIVLSV